LQRRDARRVARERRHGQIALHLEQIGKTVVVVQLAFQTGAERRWRANRATRHRGDRRRLETLFDIANAGNMALDLVAVLRAHLATQRVQFPQHQVEHALALCAHRR